MVIVLSTIIPISSDNSVNFEKILNRFLMYVLYVLILKLQTPRLRAHLPVAGVRDGVVVGLGLVLAEDVAGDLEAVGGALSAQVALPRSSHYIRLDEDNVHNVCTILL